MTDLLQLLAELLKRLGLKNRWILAAVVLGVGLVMSVVVTIILSSKVSWCNSAQGQLSQIYSSDIADSCSTATDFHTQAMVLAIICGLGFPFACIKAIAAAHPVAPEKADTRPGGPPAT